MQRRAVALYGLFLIVVVVGSGITMAVNTATTVPVSDSPEYSLQKGDNFSVNGQQYTVSDISTSTDDSGNVLRSASFKSPGSGESIGFSDSDSITMLVIRSGLPTTVSYTPSTDTVTLGGNEYGAYYPNNNSVKLMTSEVHSQELSSTNALNERFRGLWAVITLSLLTAIIIFGLSYLPRRG